MRSLILDQRERVPRSLSLVIPIGTRLRKPYVAPLYQVPLGEEMLQGALSLLANSTRAAFKVKVVTAQRRRS